MRFDFELHIFETGMLFFNYERTIRSASTF
jgi:hypothetical protein